ncbi:asparaginase domain-containing protein, partial [Escherichia coli]|uniref:asparaginase domain-containing protein n=1 Tax=Escherichia coli TaxID=562 RepID=UPI001649AF93
LKAVANAKGEQAVNIGSPDMNETFRLRPENKITTDCEKTDGLVITHGNDTMAEPAYFLNPPLTFDKPAVTVGLCHPSPPMRLCGPFFFPPSVVPDTDKS